MFRTESHPTVDSRGTGPRRPRFNRISILAAIVRAGALGVLIAAIGACAHVGEQEMGDLFQRDVVNRSQAREMLRTGVRININVCPENTVAGYYAIEAAIPSELNYPHYDGGSVSACGLLLAVTPCGLNPNSSQLFRLNLYTAMIRSCDLKQVGY